MIYILKSGKIVLNADSEEYKDQLVENGFELIPEETVASLGMKGYEHLVCPNNTVVNEDGSITFTPPAPRPLDEVKAEAVIKIDAETSAAILAGFDYEIDGESLHFSYDSFDQQNFADSANVATLTMSGVEGLPTSVTWNAYRNYTPATGGDLVRLTLTPATFLHLYTAGALVHKATQMEIGGQRKAAVEAATTIEEVQAV